MGYTILLQWTVPNIQTNLGNLILTRLLEHYNLSHPSRTSIHIRTFKASFSGTSNIPASSPSSSTENVDSTHTRLLSTITYTQASPGAGSRDGMAGSTIKDDTTYLFLDDRSPGVSEPQPEPQASGVVPPTGQSSGETDQTGAGPIASSSSKVDEDGFEIIDNPTNGNAVNANTNGTVMHPSADTSTSARAPTMEKNEQTLSSKRKGKQKEQYKMLSIRPAGAALALLQNLMSPFVMGFTKSAKATASNTASQSTLTPSPLSGQSFLMTAFTFPPLASPSPPLVITMHNLNSITASTIYLEAEYVGSNEYTEKSEEILKEFLSGCLPEGINGDVKFWTWREQGYCVQENVMGSTATGTDADEGTSSSAGKTDKGEWQGAERTRRATYMLAKSLRQGGFI